MLVTETPTTEAVAFVVRHLPTTSISMPTAQADQPVSKKSKNEEEGQISRSEESSSRQDDDESDEAHQVSGDPTTDKTTDVQDDVESEKEAKSEAGKEEVSASLERREKEAQGLEENLVCCICRDVLHDAASLLPCLHTFCAGCCSEWLTSNRTCPECRVHVTKMRRNHLVNNLVSVFLEAHPDKKRTSEDVATLDAANQFKIQNKEEIRFGSSHDEDDDEDDYDSDASDSSFGGHFHPTVHAVPFGAFGRIHHTLFPPVPTDCRACTDPSTNVDNYRCPSDGSHRMCSCCNQLLPSRSTAVSTTPPTSGPLAGTTTSTATSGTSSSTAPTSATAATTTTSATSTTATTATTATVTPVSTSTTSSGDDASTPTAPTGDSSPPATTAADTASTASTTSTTSPPAHTTAATPAPTQCGVCHSTFCNLFWTRGCMGRCSHLGGCLRKLKDMTIVDSDTTAFINKNPFESQIMREYMNDHGMDAKQLLERCLDQVADGTLTCTYSNVTGELPVCRSCGVKIFSELAFKYRRNIPASDLPRLAQVTSTGTVRADCWYGHQCRTQYNRPHHAANFNHVCDPR
eukprot:m.62101 g.62101  ORF g.62101 m.62101 type:complete len:576 (-) comp13375_c0_seq1:235-1962(-)